MGDYIRDDAVDEENLMLCCACCCANVSYYNDCDCIGCSGKVSDATGLLNEWFHKLTNGFLFLYRREFAA